MEEQELRGERTLLPDEVSFTYGVHRQEERLQFTMKNDVATDDVFGMEPGTDDDVSMYAYYDLKRGEVSDALDVTVFEEDGSKTFHTYRLSPEEKKLLLAQMQPYCLELTGMRLEAHRERFQLGQDGLLPAPQGERPDAMKHYERQRRLAEVGNGVMPDEDVRHQGKTPLKYRRRKEIVFTDTARHKLFRLPDGENLVMRLFGGDEITRPCVYVDEHHFAMGNEVHDMREFAMTMERNGWTYRPEHPGKGDVCDTYEIYQLKNGPDNRQYAFMPYSYAKGKLRPAHYELVYAGVLARETTLEDIFVKHNRDDRPFGQSMKALSMSDVVVLDRDGKRRAFYVDGIGFQECKAFLNPPRRTKGKKPRKREKPER